MHPVAVAGLIMAFGSLIAIVFPRFTMMVDDVMRFHSSVGRITSVRTWRYLALGTLIFALFVLTFTYRIGVFWC